MTDIFGRGGGRPVGGNGRPALSIVTSVPAQIRWGMDEGRKWIGRGDAGRLMKGPTNFDGNTLRAIVDFAEAKLMRADYDVSPADVAAFAVGLMLAHVEHEITLARRARG